MKYQIDFFFFSVLETLPAPAGLGCPACDYALPGSSPSPRMPTNKNTMRKACNGLADHRLCTAFDRNSAVMDHKPNQAAGKGTLCKAPVQQCRFT
ncbi:hypothetical protein IF1G_00295 [Cordyceps javanica]|uniref:Uncharacterized protein n=1 Tax=Cordyceps javanica TaxID=43265 RepID=A0A545VF63_9HYPO|nr:hypothetical protein IF1G_00295 [Cordyceps javanica]